MTPEETKAAGEVMISGGPWDWRERDTNNDWEPCEAPVWCWDIIEYRKRPEPQYVWLNVYREPRLSNSRITKHESREDADDNAVDDRVGRLKVRIEERWDD